MTTWIFQGNPDEYEVDKYLRIDKDIIWDVRQKHFRDQILVGGRVFIWRSKGSYGDESYCGIVARGKILCKPEEFQDEDVHLYVDLKNKPANYKSVDVRVKIRLDEIRLNGIQGMLRKINEIRGDNILKNIRIMKVFAETNYELSKTEAEQLEKLWESRKNNLIKNMPELDVKNLEEYNLARACNYVIEQNKDCGYNPTRFQAIVNRGIGNHDLVKRISGLILKAELLEELERIIKLNHQIITIEDLIVNKSDGFSLTEEVICQAQARSEYFSQIRKEC